MVSTGFWNSVSEAASQLELRFLESGVMSVAQFLLFLYLFTLSSDIEVI